MKRRRAFWSTETSLSALLAILVAYHLALPIAAELNLGGLPAALGVSLLAVSGVLTSFDRPWMRWGVRVAAVAAVYASWAELASPSPVAIASSVLVDLALVAFLMAAVAAQVFRPGPVTAHRVRGAIVVYLLMGVLFGLIYQIIVLAEPSAIRFSGDLSTGNLEHLRGELSYFSFVTLTTVGYGDITPVYPFARAVATLEALSGQFYLAITLARLVSNLRAVANDEREDRRSAEDVGVSR
jgi:hypothetical protein